MPTAIEVLEDAELRLEWAERHISFFEREIQAFHARDGYRLVRGVDLANPNLVRVTDPPAIPAQLNLIASDAVHSMRVSLDYLACSLALLNGRPMTGVYFPIAASAGDFAASAPSKVKKFSAEGRAFVAGLRPYKGGDDFLWAINEINKIDKHRSILVFNEAAPMFYFTPGNGHSERDPVVEAPRGGQYRIALVPGFADLAGFEGQSALTLLKEFLRSASESVAQARRAFFPNTRRVTFLPPQD
jgi:hypothetical protein